MIMTAARGVAMTAVRSQEELRDALGGAPKRSTLNAIRSRFEDVDREWLAASRQGVPPLRLEAAGDVGP
jgi:hypothetical protein